MESSGSGSRASEMEAMAIANFGSRASRCISIIEAPSNLGLMPPPWGGEPGTRKAPAVLRELGLPDRIGAQSIRTVEAPAYSADIDPHTGSRNTSSIREYSLALADAIGEELDRGAFPVVVGGDCSLLMGSGLALQRRGRFWLVFMDGQADFRSPDTSSTAGAAGMDLALLTGHGPKQLTEFDNADPLFREEDVVAFGFRDVGAPAPYSSRAIFETKVHLNDLDSIRQMGPAEAAKKALDCAAQDQTNGAWLHLDVDSLDPEIVPAVDTIDRGGFSREEARATLQVLLSDPRLRGMQLTIYDPDRDPDRRYGHLILDIIGDAFQSAERARGRT